MSPPPQDRKASSGIAAPNDIKAVSSDGVLRIVWPDGRQADLQFKPLRCACTCAGCVHEFTGEPLLDPATVPADIGVRAMKLVGNYALQITWTDGHDTGLYTWSRLSEMSGPPPA